MSKRIRFLSVVFILVLPFIFLSISHSMPPKPGPQFVWVEPYTTDGGVFIKGHWKYTGPTKRNKVWVAGHYNSEGKWVVGHWKLLGHPRPHKGAHWNPGHRGPRGRWVPGHWR